MPFIVCTHENTVHTRPALADGMLLATRQGKKTGVQKTKQSDAGKYIYSEPLAGIHINV